MKNREYISKGSEQLLESLFNEFNDQSRTTVKSYLRNRQVSVDGMTVTQFDYPLEKGNKIVISFERTKESLRHPLLRIVTEDDYWVVVNNNSGLLSIATDKEINKTAYTRVR